MSSRLAVLMSLAALVAVAAAAFGNPTVAVVGAATSLGLAAAHPAVRDPRVPVASRFLLHGVLLLCAAAVAALMWRWPAATDGMLAAVGDPRWERRLFVRHATVAGLLVLACACLGVAVGRLPRDRLRDLGPATATVAPLTLLALVLVPLIVAVVGPITAAVEVLCVLGAYVWLVRRTARRHGAAAIAAVGITPFVLLTWLAVEQAWRSRPEPPSDVAFLVVGVSVDSGPDVESGSVLAALLVGAALTVPACARLAHREPDTP
ncbi:hypothetical protein AB0J82_12320 [Asanoa sp. NPDC049518]|uniref:hypothetical protein n=1 Tax=unclassified Asanoa TaxID=2685164 RepID=UPI00341A4786